MTRSTNNCPELPGDQGDREHRALTCGGALQIVSFNLGGERYGIDIMQVQEIILPGDITELPNVGEEI